MRASGSAVPSPTRSASPQPAVTAEMTTSQLAGLTAGRRDVLVRRVRLLVAATITYNVVEAAIALGAGAVASSTALVGFGLDSVIEVS